MGSHQKYNTKGNTQAKIITKRAGISQNKLYRFSNAPTKIKKMLFKALTRSVLEYPCTTLSKINKYYTQQLQKIQNRGLRFIKNIKFKDKIKMKTVHEELDIEALNVRINRLKNKTLNKMKQVYHVTQSQEKNLTYKYSDYTIQIEPHKKKSRTIAQRIEKYLLIPRGQKNIIKEEKSIENWQKPEPIYSSTRN